LSIDSVKSFIKGNPDIERITLFGGEPIMHPELMSIATLLRKAYPKAYITMTSNGSGCYDDYIYLLDNVLNNLSISITDHGVYLAINALFENYYKKIRLNCVNFHSILLMETALNLYFRYNVALTFCGDLMQKGGNVAEQDMFSLLSNFNKQKTGPGTYMFTQGNRYLMYFDNEYDEEYNNSFNELILLPSGKVTTDYSDVMKGVI